ncbi:MAG: AAA family ATPase [Vicingaceae bacterium]
MYLSYIKVENYKGIEQIETELDPSINIFIGENGSCKSALIDAIRILYNIGEPIREIYVSNDDFYLKRTLSKDGKSYSLEKSSLISLTYKFKGLSDSQKGAFYEYMVIDPNGVNEDYAKLVINYEYTETKYPKFSYNTGNIDGQKADYKTFELFQHYYLSALRDSTRDLLTTRSNVLGRVIKRFVNRSESEADIEKIMKDANSQLLQREEVTKTRDGVNNNLEGIFKKFLDNKIGLRIEESKTEYIVNAIKPYLPHNKNTLEEEGFHLWQNSLGLNNLIYIATVLGDVKEQVEDNKTPHYSLLIEEPESHLHPQLQLSLFHFLKDANNSDNSQLFISTHSPTLTSKVPLKNLVLLDNNQAYKLDSIFKDRKKEKIILDTAKNIELDDHDFDQSRKKLERYIDVTKSQLFFAKAALFIEGISEELLISAFAKIEGYNLEDFRIELINVKGTSFYPFMHLFNSSNGNKRIKKPISILTDDDRFTDSKKSEFSFKKLLKSNYSKLDELDLRIQKALPVSRIANLNSASNKAKNVRVFNSFKTLEYELATHNIHKNRKNLKSNFLVKYLDKLVPEKITEVKKYAESLKNDLLADDERRKVGILLWKAMPSKASFAQDFSIYIFENLDDSEKEFVIPPYIAEALKHLRQDR